MFKPGIYSQEYTDGRTGQKEIDLAIKYPDGHWEGFHPVLKEWQPADPRRTESIELGFMLGMNHVQLLQEIG